MKPLDDHRVQTLLEQIETVRELSDPEQVDALFAQLGRRVHAAWLGNPEALDQSPVEWPGPEWDDLPEHDDLTDIPDPHTFKDPLADTEEPVPEGLIRLEDLRGLRADGGSPLSVSRGSSLPWRSPLDELLDLIALPADLLDPSVMPTEASKVQWASGELSSRIDLFPAPVQQALLALLAVRARNLASYLDVDIGPRMALDRLKRMRNAQDLPWVVALTPSAQPETGTWAGDARAWWELLGR